MQFNKLHRLLLIAVLITGSVACTTPSRKSSDTGTTTSPRIVTPNPHEKLGKPYYIGGIRYEPRHDPDYNTTGIASWYGPKFHGRLTANGEIFDMDRLTVAHKTLPLPSIVRVTNLENGKSVVARLNDRGPYSGDRIIDLSRKTAEVLDTKEKGLARVRVEYLGPADIKDAIVALGEPENYAALKPSKGYEKVREPEIEFAEASPLSKPTHSPQPARMADDPIAIVMSGDTLPATMVSPTLEEVERREVPDDRKDDRLIAFFVQVGVFDDPRNATAAASRFDKIVPLTVENVDVSGRALQRLRIGPYLHEFAAEAAKREAVSQGFHDAHIVRGGILF